MAKEIEQKLKESALKLFSSNHYDDVSIAQICRDAEVSNGIFYWYFKNKEDIWKFLMDEFLVQYGKELSVVSGNNPSERLLSFIETVFRTIRKYQFQFSVFREGQYRVPHYESLIRKEYLKILNFILGRDVNESEYIYIIGGLRFLSIRSLYHDINIDTNLAYEIITSGVFNCQALTDLSEATNTVEEKEPPATSGEQLLDAGLKLLGTNKYKAVQIADIVREAKLSVGTFYKNFDSKEQFMERVVYQIGHSTRYYLSTHAPGKGSRLEKEIVGIWNFLSYFSQRKNYYSILREAEFVVPNAVKGYYDSFEQGYMRNLDLVPSEHRSIVANYLMGLSHYLGLELLFSDRIKNPRQILLEIGDLLRAGIDTGPV